MSSSKLIETLRGAADVVKPFARPPHPGGLVWNGTEYRPSSGSAFDPYALSWWGILTTAADLLEAQGQPMTSAQRDYLEKVLFGGMGSLSDFMLDVNRMGEPAREANAQLDHARKEMLEELRRS